jgi:uncharacterized protein YeaO (DUF488 family)
VTAARRSFSSPACYLHEFDVPKRSRGFELKRIYDPPAADDGFRVLVDRLWPRGLAKSRAALDGWLKEVAPSSQLRQWFHKDRERWPEFAKRYRAELRTQATLLQELRKRARHQRVTLLYASRDPDCNHALILRAVLLRQRRAP